jgi:hypothetical protein
MKNTPLSSKDSKAFVKKLNTLLKVTGKGKAALAAIGDTHPSTMKAWLLGANRVTVEGQLTFETALEGRILDLEKELEALDRFLGEKTFENGFAPVK